MTLPNDMQEQRDALERIMRQDEYAEYRREQGSSLSDWLGMAFRKVGDWLEGLLPDVRVGAQPFHVLSYLFLIAALLLAAYLIYRIVRMYNKGGRVGSTPARRKDERSYTYGDYRLRAREAAAEGKLREAVRYGFLALLLFYQSHRYITMHQWKTNWEYAEELRTNSPDDVEGFRDAAGLFDRVWYGRSAPAPADCAKFLDRMESRLKGGGEHVASRG